MGGATENALVQAPANSLKSSHQMHPALFRIVNTDWPALFAAIGIPMALVITALHSQVFPSASSKWEMFFALGVPSALICAGVLAWRCQRIIVLFRSGLISSGRIIQIQLSKDRGRIDFNYEWEWNGATRQSWQPVHQSKKVLALEVGQEVQLLVHPRKSGVAIIKHLFDAP